MVVQPRLAHIPQLDGIRAIAIMLVLAAHIPGIAGFPLSRAVFKLVQSARTGYFGVDLFFVLSGFLITRILAVELSETNRIDFKSFYVKRALRILPAYYLCTVFCLVFFKTSLAEFIVTATYTTNFELLPNVSRPMEHTWSLSVEEQFYLVWPLLLLSATLRRSVWLTLYVLPAAAVCSAVLLAVIDPGPFGALLIYQLPITRMLSLSLGAFLAFRSLGNRQPGVGASFAICIAGVVLAVCAVSARSRGLLPPAAPYWVVNLLACAMVSFGFFAAALSAGSQSTFVRCLSAPAVRYVGRISYGLYLYHYVVLFAFGINEANTATSGAPARLLLAATAVTLAVTVASYHGFEVPIMRLRARLPALREQTALSIQPGR